MRDAEFFSGFAAQQAGHARRIKRATGDIFRGGVSQVDGDAWDGLADVHEAVCGGELDDAARLQFRHGGRNGHGLRAIDEIRGSAGQGGAAAAATRSATGQQSEGGEKTDVEEHGAVLFYAGAC